MHKSPAAQLCGFVSSHQSYAFSAVVQMLRPSVVFVTVEQYCEAPHVAFESHV
jgi:hypothetical protein